VTRKQLSSLGRLGISLFLLALLFRSVGVSDVAAQLRSARPAPLLGAVALYCAAGTWVRGRRWRALIRSLGSRISVMRTIELFLVGTLFSQVLPTGLGGDVVRGLMLGREGLGSARALSSVVVDRALGVLPLLAAGLVAVALAPGHGGPVVTLALFLIGLAGVAAMALLFQAERVRRALAGVPGLGRLADLPLVVRFAEAFGAYSRPALAEATAWGVLFTLLLLPANALLGRAVGIDRASLADWCVVVPLASLSMLLPSVGGWGVREWSYVGLLGLLDPPVSPQAATAVSLLFGALNLVLAACGGLVIMLRGALGLPRIGEVSRLADPDQTHD
jgi:uncharacterized membrane protein YbhN (UPF0104 family)